MGNDVEAALLRRAQGGDRQAFSRLVAAHREPVYRAAYWVLKDPEEAMDATQEAFLRAYRHLQTFAGRSSFRTWARRIATNVALDRLARRRREESRTQSLPESGEVAERGRESVGAALEREERRELVRAAIEELPPAQRAAVVLRDVEGLSYQEIAETLSIPKGTVMSRIYYGRKALKEKLAGVLGPEAERIRASRAAEERARAAAAEQRARLREQAEREARERAAEAALAAEAAREAEAARAEGASAEPAEGASEPEELPPQPPKRSGPIKITLRPKKPGDA